MRCRQFLCLALSLLSLATPTVAWGSAYNSHPKLAVIIVIDQFRGDYLERYRDQFGEGGFRLFLDHGAYFADCNYNYANTRTAPGHATLLTGAYSNGHGIIGNEFWDPERAHKKDAAGKSCSGKVTSVFDADQHVIGTPGTPPEKSSCETGSASPHNLLASTLGDELKLATRGESRVFSISLKDRSAVLPGGFSADTAFWPDSKTGQWISSSYYHSVLPAWVDATNQEKCGTGLCRQQLFNQARDWLVSKKLRTPEEATAQAFYNVVGPTPLSNDFELQFAEQLIDNEKLGRHKTTDLLVISLSGNDILGHEVGPDSDLMREMALAMDKQLAAFFRFLGARVGLAETLLALSADHGIAPIPAEAAQLRIPAQGRNQEELSAAINASVSERVRNRCENPAGKENLKFVPLADYSLVWLDQDAFAKLCVPESEAEKIVGEVLVQKGFRSYFTRSQLAQGQVPPGPLGQRYLNSYSPEGGWYVLAVPGPFTIGSKTGTDHASPYTYDTHVPLAFYGLAFRPGIYRTHAEPVDLAATLASLLGINAPTHCVGRVLTEALAPSPERTGARP